MAKVHITIRIDQELDLKAKAKAEEEDRSKSEIINRWAKKGESKERQEQNKS